MKPRLKQLLLLALFCLIPGLGHGADNLVKTELVTLAFNGSFPGYYYRNGKEILKLEASRQGISAPISYAGAATLSLFENKADLAPRKEGEERPKASLQVNLPTGSDRVLVVFAYTSKKKRTPLAKAYSISTQSMKEGAYRLFNFSKQNVFVVLNGQKAAVAPGKKSDISAASWKREVQDMEVSFGLKKGDKIQSVYTSVWGHRPIRRSFVFVFDRPDKYQPLDIRMFYDVPSITASQGKNQPANDPASSAQGDP